MGGLFGGHHGGSKPPPAPTPPPATPQTNGAAVGASQNYGSSSTLSNQANIARGTFLGS